MRILFLNSECDILVILIYFLFLFSITGTLYRWSLILYGTKVDPLTKNVHVPTLSTEDTAVTYSTVASPKQSAFKIPTPTPSPSGTLYLLMKKIFNAVVF